MSKMKNNPALSYLQNRIETATPEQLTLMLLEGACRYAILAEQCLTAEDYINSNSHLQRCQLILEELLVSLDMSAGPVADNLYKIYEYLHYRLVQANVRKSAAIMPEVIGHLTDLRDCWHKAMTEIGGKGSA